YTQAAEAYSKVGRDSPEFSTMLYELAWVYVRLGDVQRAERALEVLQVADPSSSQAGDATLLRADLLLRAGAFDKSLQLYLGVREEYEPMRQKLEAFIEQTPDPAVYYDKLSQQQLDVLDQNEQLPPTAVRWAREAEDGPMAFAVIDDVNQCKALIRQSYLLIDKLNIILNASNRVRAFPELHAGEEKALALINRISKMRVVLAKGLDSEEPSDLSGEIAQARAQRRALQAQMGQLPVTTSEFAERDYQGTRQWNTVSQELTRRGVEIDYLNATINGLRRMLKEDAQSGLARDPASLKRFNEELDENERLLKQKQDEVVELRRQIEIGRAQIGLGDARYQSDAQARVTFRDALEREVQLAAQGQAGADGGSSSRAPSRTASSSSSRSSSSRSRRGSARSRGRSKPSASRSTATTCSSARSTARRMPSSARSPSATSASYATRSAGSSSAPTSASPSRRGRFARRSSSACTTSRPSVPVKSSSSTRSCARCSTTPASRRDRSSDLRSESRRDEE
ncbi:MAG: tetratricopeptide repeat protein, partial [Myxococcales bacterium]|nr:tetratricopeptide repeat protein [Myxococcales bacterium]